MCVCVCVCVCVYTLYIHFLEFLDIEVPTKLETFLVEYNINPI